MDVRTAAARTLQTSYGSIVEENGRPVRESFQSFPVRAARMIRERPEIKIRTEMPRQQNQSIPMMRPFTNSSGTREKR